MHTNGIMPLLTEMNDAPRVMQYTKLWNDVTSFYQKGAHIPHIAFEFCINYYENARLRSPESGEECKVGEIDMSSMSAQQSITSYVMKCENPYQVTSSSSNRQSPSQFQSPRTPADWGSIPKVAVCMKFNDNECKGTEAECPRKLPHQCCRCGQKHAANSGSCSKADPRNQGGSPASSSSSRRHVVKRKRSGN
jgi:hypothetical protein